jgi:hypothetical protein
MSLLDKVLQRFLRILAWGRSHVAALPQIHSNYINMVKFLVVNDFC